MKALFDFQKAGITDAKEKYHDYLRTYAAIQAMKGIISNERCMVTYCEIGGTIAEMIAKDAIIYADELLEQLSKS